MTTTRKTPKVGCSEGLAGTRDADEQRKLTWMELSAG